MNDRKRAILINLNDNVAMVLSKVEKNEKIILIHNGRQIDNLQVLDDIEIYHKVAIKSINEKEKIYKYDEVIGEAVKVIQKGQHVHVDNIKSVMVKQ
ncbi:UxaA family hydrolase [Garciella nitratireducens]|uniref:UxaA family hydrolase n=1 Tax=Garciella nitratireducens TaxID=218205 RepID=UPI001BD63D2E